MVSEVLLLHIKYNFACEVLIFIVNIKQIVRKANVTKLEVKSVVNASLDNRRF